MRKDIRDIWHLCEPYVTDAGFELVEVHSGREVAGWVVRLYIDRPGSTGTDTDVAPSVEHGVAALLGSAGGADAHAVGVSLEDCERVSRDISAALDVADVIPHAYVLEVSSPGLDRPLRRERDFSRFAGERARIRLQDGIDGRRSFAGTLRGAKDGLLEVECDGRSYQLPIADVVKANLVPDWDKELKRSTTT